MTDRPTLTGAEVRRRFLEYFAGKGHTVVPSGPLVPGNDPTLLFTNAGMVPFKDVFTGRERRPYSRATSSQKCLRVSGKHNDLETVGRTARHHTFFEMLGNFSFGDYFKEEAITFAWEFVTGQMGLPVERLYATVFTTDDEAAELWAKISGLPPERIQRFGEKDNFWSMGETGPCGPCSEIHYDRGPEHACGNPDCGIDCECDRYLEIWNLVFMQYERSADGTMTDLPKPSVDTGMGLERLVSVIQGCPTNYETDLILPVIRHMERFAEAAYGASPETDVSFRVIGDHARAVAFLIADGVMPSNEGRGYVLRRILRRALRHGRMLGVTDPFLHHLVETVAEVMHDAYPELTEHASVIRGAVLAEERGFAKTLDVGMELLAGMIEKAGRGAGHGAGAGFGDGSGFGGGVISGEDAFRLYDTYGFPIDLANDIAGDAGLSIDMAAFEALMTGQKEKARASWKGGGNASLAQVYRDLTGSVPATTFLGYETEEATATVAALIRDGVAVDTLSEGERGEVVLDATPFYAESGGQAADRGTLVAPTGRCDVTGVSKPDNERFVHAVTVHTGSVKVGEQVAARVDHTARAATRRNHSATHLLHAALREVLGTHVKQAGSAVGPDRLRFDFTHYAAPDAEELARIERLVNEQVCANDPVVTEVKGIEEATAGGAMALFGEKYGEKVRVVAMGDFSQELCGGTHASATGDIGLFKIVAESAVAAGVRRIEAVTGMGAVAFVQEREAQLKEVAELFKASPADAAERVERQFDKIRQLEKENRQLKEKLVAGGGSAADEVAEVGGVKVVAAQLDGADAKALRAFVDDRKNRYGSVIVAVGAVEGEKVMLAVGVTDDLKDRYPAGKIVGAMAEKVGGKGGGRPDMAQAGGKEPEKLPEAIAAVPAIVAGLGA